MAIDYTSVIINAIFTGLGVAIGGEIWSIIKLKKENITPNLNTNQKLEENKNGMEIYKKD